jgi:hypothetical protein
MMMEAARTSQTSFDNYFTRQYISEDNSELHTRRRENLKSHADVKLVFRKSKIIKHVCAASRNSSSSLCPRTLHIETTDRIV